MLTSTVIKEKFKVLTLRDILLLSILVGLVVVVLLPNLNIVIDYSQGRIEEWLALFLSFILLVFGAIFFRSGKKAVCLLFPIFLSLNFKLLSIGILGDEFWENNLIGYRPWVLIFDPLVIFVFLAGIINLRPHRISRTIKTNFLPVTFYIFFLLSGLLSFLRATDSTYAWIGFFALTRFLAWYISFLILFTNDIRMIKYVVWGLAGFIFVQSVFSIFQALGIQTIERLFEWSADKFVYAGDIIRVGGTVTRATLESMFLLIIPTLFAYANSSEESVRSKRVLMFCAILGMVVVFMTGSRGPIIATAIGVAVALRIYKFIGLQKRSIRNLSLIILVFILGVTFVLLSGDIQNTLLRNTATYRFETFQVAIRMITDSPFLGIGLNNYLIVGPNYGMSESLIRFGRPVHNQYLMIAAETGVIGLTVFLMLLVFWWQLTRKAFVPCQSAQLCWLTKGVQGSIIALLLTSLLDAPLIKIPVMMPLAILIAAVGALASYSNISPSTANH